MCNEAVRRKIVERLFELGSVCSESASNSDLRKKLGVESSNTVFKRALGSAVHREMVVRHRPVATGLYDDDRPITLMPGPAARQLVPGASQQQPYFVS